MGPSPATTIDADETPPQSLYDVGRTTGNPRSSLRVTDSSHCRSNATYLLHQWATARESPSSSAAKVRFRGHLFPECGRKRRRSRLSASPGKRPLSAARWCWRWPDARHIPLTTSPRGDCVPFWALKAAGSLALTLSPSPPPPSPLWRSGD